MERILAEKVTKQTITRHLLSFHRVTFALATRSLNALFECSLSASPHVRMHAFTQKGRCCKCLQKVTLYSRALCCSQQHRRPRVTIPNVNVYESSQKWFQVFWVFFPVLHILCLSKNVAKLNFENTPIDVLAGRFPISRVHFRENSRPTSAEAPAAFNDSLQTDKQW